jgi:hypothetical protein
MNKHTLRMLIYMTHMSYAEIAEIIGTSDRRLLSQTAKNSTYSKLSPDEIDVIIDIARNAPAVCPNKMLLKSVMVSNSLKYKHIKTDIRSALQRKGRPSVVAANRAMDAICQQYGRDVIERGKILMQSVERILSC